MNNVTKTIISLMLFSAACDSAGNNSDSLENLENLVDGGTSSSGEDKQDETYHMPDVGSPSPTPQTSDFDSFEAPPLDTYTETGASDADSMEEGSEGDSMGETGHVKDTDNMYDDTYSEDTGTSVTESGADTEEPCPWKKN